MKFLSESLLEIEENPLPGNTAARISLDTYSTKTRVLRSRYIHSSTVELQWSKKGM